MPINYKVLRKEIGKGFNSLQARRAAFNEMEKRVRKAKRETIKEFRNHPVTKEINAGPASDNKTGSLGGRGNLFTFIGFPEGANPTAIIETMFGNARVNKNLKVRSLGKGGMFELEFNITIPSKRDMQDATPMPFEGGRSWLTAIEKGISGLSYYIYSKLQKFKTSRSGGGIQVSTPYIPGLRYKPTSYISPILRQYKRRILKS